MLKQTLLALLLTLTAAQPHLGPRTAPSSFHAEVLSLRTSSTPHTRSPTTQTTCIDPLAAIHPSDETVAQLSICGGIAGASTGCPGTESRSEGAYRSAHFTVYAPEGTLGISKEGWVRCVQGAREVCATGSLSAVCEGEGVAFTLMESSAGEL